MRNQAKGRCTRHWALRDRLAWMAEEEKRYRRGYKWKGRICAAPRPRPLRWESTCGAAPDRDRRYIYPRTYDSVTRHRSAFWVFLLRLLALPSYSAARSNAPGRSCPRARTSDSLAGAGLFQRNSNLLELFFSARAHHLDGETILANVVRGRAV